MDNTLQRHQERTGRQHWPTLELTKALIITAACNQRKNRHRSMQQNSSEKDHTNLVSLVLKQTQRQFNEEGIISGTNGTVTIGHPCKNYKPNRRHYTMNKVNLKCIIVFSRKLKLQNCSKKIQGESVCDLECLKQFHMPPQN